MFYIEGVICAKRFQRVYKLIVLNDEKNIFQATNLNFSYICQKWTTVELHAFIKTLLYNRDTLIIPGLGTLITRYKPAEIDVSNNIISPPTKYLIFDQQSGAKDNTLEQFIAKQKEIDEEEARDLINDEVNTINTKLESGETVLMEGIGYFSKEGDTIRFDHDQQANFLTESFGLSKVDYKPVELKHTPQTDPQVAFVYRKKSYGALYITIGILLLAGGAAYLYYPEIRGFIDRKQGKKVIVNVSPVIKKDSVVRAVSIEDTVKHDTLEKIFDDKTVKKNALAIKKETEKKSPVSPKEGTFYIIAGSFKTSQRSQVLVKILNKEGLKADVIEFAPDLFRVSLGSFNNRNEAITALNKLKTEKGKEAVWLLKK